MSHTPGPWRVSNNGVGMSVSAGGIRISQSGYVGAACMQTQQADIERRNANARLIAAAPELLEALESVLCLARLKWGNLDKDANVVFESAESLIKKAKGGE